ncbi:MAG: hypothetical protein ABJZ91_10590 [Cyclobacteriaceae bacterium]
MKELIGTLKMNEISIISVILNLRYEGERISCWDYPSRARGRLVSMTIQEARVRVVKVRI